MTWSATTDPPASDILLDDRPAPGPLVVVSHRGPVQFGLESGQRVANRGAGGLVTAFAGLGERLEDTVWVCAAMSDEDRVVAAENREAFSVAEAGGWRLRMLDIDPERHRQFYAMIANPLLWFIQHGLWDLSDAPDIGPSEHEAWSQGYVAVNASFADAVMEVVGAGPRPSVLVQDYHLYLVPGLVRRRCPEAFVNLFCHIPWPHPDAWKVLPPSWRRTIFEGILGADIVGFHTEDYARNFLAGCERLLGLEVDYATFEVIHDGRRVAAKWYPISVDAEQFEQLAASPAVLAHEADLIANRRDKLIVRVDRTDLSKNILRGFRAYDLLLDRHPELRERVMFLALLQPSRQDVTEYVDYLERIRRTVADLNLKHGTPDWQPVDLRLVDDMDLAVAAYKQFDALLVNAIADGMNLVAKEAILVNERNGVLLLSETTGAHAELGRMALTVYPFDVDQQAEALWRALTMDEDEREGRREACASVVRRNDLHRWLEVQLEDKAALGR